MTRQDTVAEVREAFLACLSNVTEGAEGWTASCPVPGHGQGRGDRNPSLSVDEGNDRLLVNCFADCSTESVVEAIGWTMADLFPRASDKVVLGGKDKPLTDSAEEEGCTLEAYAGKTGLPKDFLSGASVEEARYRDKPFLKFQYFDQEGQAKRYRSRVRLNKDEGKGDQRFKWGPGSKQDIVPYGLERYKAIKEAGYVVVAEGETDRLTLLYHGIESIGIPGANNWREEWISYLEDVGRIYFVPHCDEPGENLLDKVARSLPEELKTHLFVVRLPEIEGVKDVNDLCRHKPDSFKDTFRRLVAKAERYVCQEEAERQEQVKALWEECRELAENPDILAEFEADLKKAGVVGQAKEAKIIYLASTSRHLSMPSSIIIKGPSGAGKSYVLNKVLSFKPGEGYYKLSAMSEKALAHFNEPLKHRHLVIAEAAAIENSEMATYLVRTLLSEGYLHYVYPLATPDGIVNYEVNVEGPTGLFMTTTQLSINQENETRLLSITVDDTKAQTRAVILGPEDEDEDLPGPDMTRWHTLEYWISTAGVKKVRVPYRRWLAQWIPEAALSVRLRRDFTQIINLIKAHALLHQASRRKDDRGRIIADVEDYRVVRELLYDIIAEGLEASVPKTVRQTVEVLSELYEGLEDKTAGVRIAPLSRALHLDESSARRRMGTAIRRGFAKNLEERSRQAARYAPADPMPKDITVLPEAEELEASLGTEATKVRGGTEADKHIPHENTRQSDKVFAHTSVSLLASVTAAPKEGQYSDDHHGTPDQEELIREFVEQGMDPEFVRAEVLGDDDEEEAGGMYFG